VRRRFGQHFLTDPAILDRIVAALDPTPEDIVLEIGAGKGDLTRRLAPMVARVIAIEKDRDLVRKLREERRVKGEVESRLPSNVTVMEGDALKLDWHSAVVDAAPHASRFTLHGLKVVGNIPYYITSPLIEKALTPPQANRIVFLVQSEVADRLAATPGTKSYGALTIGVAVAAAVERLFTVKAGAFSPPPKVHSAAVRISPLSEPLVEPGEITALRRFVTAVFGQRRKQLRRVLRTVAGVSKDRADSLLSGLGLDPTVRPELLEPTDFVRLFRAVAR
jgi:16S rRNA (adenine1518-N6/adenine1519-N6)-dimethyltransferase